MKVLRLLSVSSVFGCYPEQPWPNMGMQIIDEATGDVGPSSEEEVPVDAHPLPIIVDKFTRAREVCELPGDWYNDPLWYENISGECAEQIEKDLGAGPPVGEFNESSVEIHYLRLHRSIYYLLAIDLMDVDEVGSYPVAGEISDCLGGDSAAALAVLSEIGEDTGQKMVNAVLYNFITSSIDEVYLTDEETGTDLSVNASADIDSRSVKLYRSLFMEEVVPVLAHEAAHIWMYSRHSACPEGHPYEGRTVCDYGWVSPYGVSAVAGAIMYISPEVALTPPDIGWRDDWASGCRFASHLIVED